MAAASGLISGPTVEGAGKVIFNLQDLSPTLNRSARAHRRGSPTLAESSELGRQLKLEQMASFKPPLQDGWSTVFNLLAPAGLIEILGLNR
jgi:hypothetical protein